MKKTLLVISILLLLAASACDAALPQAESTPQSYPNPSYPNPINTQQRTPLTEADVPRVTVEESKLAFDNGEAIIVDVRSAESYATGHAAGAINIPLDQFENSIANIPLEKDQWIITYCT